MKICAQLHATATLQSKHKCTMENPLTDEEGYTSCSSNWKRLPFIAIIVGFELYIHLCDGV